MYVSKYKALVQVQRCWKQGVMGENRRVHTEVGILVCEGPVLEQGKGLTGKGLTRGTLMN